MQAAGDRNQKSASICGISIGALLEPRTLRARRPQIEQLVAGLADVLSFMYDLTPIKHAVHASKRLTSRF